jgi:hypothetical protein
MVFFQRYKDVTISCSKQATGRVLRVQCGVWQSDVVQDVVHLIGGNRLADGFLNVVAKSCCLFDTCAGLGPYMQDEGTVITGWKEVLT